ncbi:MAG: hypothetical protein OXB99_07325 [Acidimicrobiaceae bacterium]|nr:hypothetical protein [Acidimicrobiaceae bacterium]
MPAAFAHEGTGHAVDNYPVSGHATSPVPGRYAVTSKSEDAISYNWLVTMEHMVRFTTDDDDAAQLYGWTSVGTPVIVLG